MSLADVRAEFVAATATLEGVTVYPNLPATPELPCVLIGFPTLIEMDATLAGGRRYELPLTLLVSMSDVDRAEAEFDAILDGPLVGLIHDHPSIVWRAIHVDNITNIRSDKVGNAAVLAADLNTTLIA